MAFTPMPAMTGGLPPMGWPPQPASTTADPEVVGVEVRQCSFEFQWHVATGIWNGTDCEVHGNVKTSIQGRLDGVDLPCSVSGGCLAVKADPDNITPQFFHIGQTFLGGNIHPYDGQIAAVVVYNTVLGKKEIAAVERYLIETYIDAGGDLENQTPLELPVTDALLNRACMGTGPVGPEGEEDIHLVESACAAY